MVELASLPLAPSQLHLLSDAGFKSSDDVAVLTPSELSKELCVSPQVALSILEVIRNATNRRCVSEKSAYDLLKEEEQEGCIVTFCAALDEMMGGGVPLGKITEFCGGPGLGKTQLGMQLSVDVQIPTMLGGVGGEAVYIDTEGSLICTRLSEIATAAVSHLLSVAENDGNPKMKAVCKDVNLEKILSGIHVYRCHDYIELVALSYVLPEFLRKHQQVKLIVLDSIAYHFRHDFEDMPTRTRVLQGLVQSFIRMAHEFQLAVVFMNQMTTKISKGSESRLIPALGESWGHACTVRVILYSENSQRLACLYKSPTHQEAVVPYDITEHGIRDVQRSPEARSQSFTTREDLSLVAHKRSTQASSSDVEGEHAEGERHSKRSRID